MIQVWVKHSPLGGGIGPECVLEALNVFSENRKLPSAETQDIRGEKGAFLVPAGIY